MKLTLKKIFIFLLLGWLIFTLYTLTLPSLNDDDDGVLKLENSELDIKLGYKYHKNNNNSVKTISIGNININKNTKIQHIVIGFCCECHTYTEKNCDIFEKLCTDASLPVIPTVNGTYSHLYNINPNKNIKYILHFQPNKRNGLWFEQQTSKRIFLKDRYNSNNKYNQSVTDDIWKQYMNQKLSDSQIWIQPDIYLCLGWWLDKSIKDTRQSLFNNRDSDDKSNNYFKYNIRNGSITHDVPQNIIKLPKHLLSMKRSFIVTQHYEPYVYGQSCSNYDILFDSCINRGGINDFDAKCDKNGNNCKDKWYHYSKPFSGCQSIYLPIAYTWDFYRKNNSLELLLPPNKEQHLKKALNIKRNSQPNRFLLFMSERCYDKVAYQVDILYRVMLFKKIRDHYNKTDGLGICHRDYDALKAIFGNNWKKHFMIRPRSDLHWKNDYVVQLGLKYKYMMSMENTHKNGLITEKLLNGLYAHTIPIYFGDFNIHKRFNTKRFINCQITNGTVIEMIRQRKYRDMGMKDAWNYSDTKNKTKEKIFYDNVESIEKAISQYMNYWIDVCFQKIVKIENNETLYHEMLMEPVFIDNKYDDKVIINPLFGGKQLYSGLKQASSYLINNY